ncbi:DHHC zinc finger domain containing protein [Histomonas meleagridis]|uniref:DHHC zinc finger domain containing protein n=1 Tax=Histomonas meleagridis TaxID=135588 RepID=UPI00355A171B|nr:DHHC zinc finger domain containing protein [Histomonas meleagridis]KAH0797667.1 DHHC zinc finger domain containing protein [Histomonas meleagridis]
MEPNQDEEPAQVPNEVPPPTEWNQVCKCLCCKVAKVPSLKSLYINQWQCKINISQITMLGANVICYVFSMITIPNFSIEWVKIPFYVLLTFFVFMYFLCYFMTMFSNPGYVSYTWDSDRRSPFNYSYEELMDGIITTDEQLNYVKSHRVPSRSRLSGKAHRLVVRADHICGWVGNWIGLMNHRYFIQMLFWETLSFLTFYLITIATIVNVVKYGWKKEYYYIIMFILGILSLPEFYFNSVMMISQFTNVTLNRTSLEKSKAKKLRKEGKKEEMTDYDIGCMRNWSQVMGPEKFCPIWMFPCPYGYVVDGLTYPKKGKTPYDPILQDNEKRNDFDA